MSFADEHGLPEVAPEKEGGRSPRQEHAAANDSNTSSVRNEASTGQGLVPDLDAAVAYLQWRSAAGPWVLTAISNNAKDRTVTDTFRQGDEDRMASWIARQNDELARNVYYHVNGMLRPLAKKAEKTDVASLDWLHVDIDPMPGKNIDEERARIRAMLAEHEGLPPLSCIVFSGGGYHAFWRLKEPARIDGDLAKAGDAERYNIQVELLLGADACHDVSRILRLPGTINHPNDKKRAKGQKPELAYVVEKHEDRVYPLSVFTKAPQPAEARDVSGGPAPTRLVIDHSKVGGSVTFPETLHPAAKQLVEDGCEVAVLRDILDRGLLGAGNKIHEWIAKESRNEPQHWATIEMLRCDMSPEQVMTVLTEDKYGISRAIKTTSDGKTRPGWRRYADRQVRQANHEVEAERDAATDDAPKPEVEIPTDRNPDCDVARALGKVLRDRGFYNYGGTLTYLRRGRLHAPSDTEAVTVFQRHVQFFGWKRKPGPKDEYEKVPKRLAPQHAKILRVAPDLLDELLPIHAVYDVPILLPDCAVQAGYRDGVFCYGEAPPDVPFEEAKAELLDLLRDAPTATPHDRARLVFSYLQPAIQFGRLLGERVNFPVTVLEADTSLAGKGTQVELRATIYGSKPHNITPHEGGVGGIREELSRAYVEGHPFVCLQNWKGQLDSAGLESGITDGSFNARLPGGRQVTVDPSSRDHSMTVNGAQTTVDFANRSSVVRLRKRPDDYKWHVWPDGNIKQHAAKNARYYLGCAYGVLREWLRRERRVNQVHGHDFKEWAGAAHYVCVDLLGLADPIADLRDIQRRISTGNANWARDLVLTIKGANMLGTELSASQVVDLMHSAGVEVPGVKPGEDIATPAVRDNALRSVGRALGLVFATAEAHQSGDATVAEVVVDEHRLRRVSRPRPSDRTKTDKRYVVLPPGDSEPSEQSVPF